MDERGFDVRQLGAHVQRVFLLAEKPGFLVAADEELHAILRGRNATGRGGGPGSRGRAPTPAVLTRFQCGFFRCNYPGVQ